MKNFIHKTLFVAICSTAVIGCKPKFDEPSADAGSADFSNYVSIGDGTPGGYADAALNRESQLAAFPNILATQLKSVGGGDFVQPLVLPYYSALTTHTYESFGFENGKPGTKYDLQYRTLCGGSPELHPEMVDSAILVPTKDLLAILNFKVELPPTGGHYNNFAAQGTKMIYVNAKPGTGWFHAPKTGSLSATYWKKISSTTTMTGAGASTMLKDAIAAKPTFVSINVGGVDVLRFGKSGGNQDGGDDDMITPIDEFRDSLSSMMDGLTAHKTNAVKGVIANIIGLNSFPYFTYLKYNGLVLTQAQADELNTLTAGQFSFHAGANNYVIEDANATNTCKLITKLNPYTETTCKCRQIKDNEYILIEIQDSLRICSGLGSKTALRKRWVLDADEIATINTTIDAYNDLLKKAAAGYNFAYVDGHSTIKEVVVGTQVQGIPLTSEFVKGNQFSLDGLNISPFAQAVLANACIVEINKTYGSTIPLYDVSKARGVLYH